MREEIGGSHAMASRIACVERGSIKEMTEALTFRKTHSYLHGFIADYWIELDY